MDHVGYRTPITFKEKTLCFDIANFQKCHKVLRGMAHLISVYKLNKTENQDHKSKMFQIFKLGICQLHRNGDKIYATKTSHQDHLQNKRLRSSELESLSCLQMRKKEFSLSLSLSVPMVGVQLQEVIFHYFSLFCPTEALNFTFSSSFAINIFFSKSQK